MAAANAPRPPGSIDPLKGMKYSIQLGDSLSDRSKQERYVSVKFNHKPKHTSPNQRTTVTNAGQKSKYNLVIADDSPSSPSGVTYKYQGTLDPHTSPDQTDSPYSYGLVYSHEKNSFVLERISADYHFNLISNPGKATKSQLAQQYPQLSVHADPETGEEEDDLFQEGGSYSDSDASAADDDNPYDYRHFLPDGIYAPSNTQNDMSRSASPNLGGTSPYLSGQSPNPNAYLSAPSPALKPKPKASQAQSSKPAPRSTAAPVPAKPKATAPSKPRKPSPPRIVEDLYSPHSSSESDSDSGAPRRSKAKSKSKHSSSDLIIDLGSPPPQAKRRQLPKFKNAKKGGAPISFREATSASENEGDADESGSDIDMLRGRAEDAEGESDPDFEMDDGDVEVLKLPSPARVQDNLQRTSSDAVGLGLGADMMDEEDDLAAALTMELEKDAAAQQEEESEVSEEE